MIFSSSIIEQGKEDVNMTDEKYNRLLQAAVPSKDVREYCKKLGRVFEPYELATLITQNSLLSYSQQDVLLAELIPELRAEPNAASRTINGISLNDIPICYV